jgi:hypothetical protein
MGIVKQQKTKRLNQSERAEALKGLHFPDWPTPWVWSRKEHDGYTTMPRTMPIVMQAIDQASKGQPAGHVLLCLWARSPDGPMLTIESQAVFAAEAGFSGERAIDTWRRRMRRLCELGFIETKEGASGDFHYILLVNPNLAMVRLKRRADVSDLVYGRFIERIHEVGATNELITIEAELKSWEEQKAAEAMTAKATS